MSTDLLFEQFATLATAPEGNARLRELILQLAVQGKLGTQVVGDEPAKILPRITKERKNESDGKTRKKKENVGDPIDLDNVSSSCIQKGWTICRLSDCLELINGRAYSMPELLSEGTPIIRIQNLNGGKDWYYSNLNLEPDKYCDDGDLLFAWSGTFGPYIWNGSKSIYHYHIWKIKLSNSILDSFAFYLLKHLSDKIRSASHGLMLPHMTKQDMENVLIRLPPLAEQHRIVSKVDRLMALCDELEARQKQERAVCFKLGTASLAGLQNATHQEEFGRQWAHVCDAFDLILDCPENVKVLRQTIFQLAVQGRLVRQEPGDEPATVLLEKITEKKRDLVKAGKIKQEKSIKQIESADIPYLLPEGWIWAHLSDVYDIRDGTHETPKYYDEGVPFVMSKNIYNGHLDLDNIQYISREDHEKFILRSLTEKGDILFGMIGGSIGNTVLVNVDAEFSIKNIALFKYYSLELSVPKYLYYFSVLAGNKMRQTSTGGAQAFVSLKFLRDYLIPLPPLAEQRRIVAKIDALMALCDALESRLKERAGIHTKFTDAVVKNIGTG